MEIHENEITALIGPSGCGKSTLIRCLNRMNDLIPTATVEGHCYYHGQDLYGARGRSGRGPQADRDGLPEAEPVPEVDLRQRRLRAAGAGAARRQGAGRASAALGGPLGRGQGPPRRERLRDVRRPAAAALHRPLHRGRPRRDPDGRALLGARPDLDREDRGPDAGAEGAVLDRDRHPQHAAGGARLEPDGVPDRRARRRGGEPLGPARRVRRDRQDLHQPLRPRTEDYVTGKVG